jgi:uncharacterized protein YecE (DUF72 family)
MIVCNEFDEGFFMEKPMAYKSTILFIPASTTDTAYVRLHGRNKDNWLKKGIETSLRYAYLYSNTELK